MLVLAPRDCEQLVCALVDILRSEHDAVPMVGCDLHERRASGAKAAASRLLAGSTNRRQPSEADDEQATGRYRNTTHARTPTGASSRGTTPLANVVPARPGSERSDFVARALSIPAGPRRWHEKIPPDPFPRARAARSDQAIASAGESAAPAPELAWRLLHARVMRPPERIVLASDFGAAARHAVNDAALLARAYAAELFVVHVHSRVPRTEVSARALNERTARFLASTVRDLADQGVTVAGTEVARGSPAETILHTADALGADCIVVGTGDRSATQLLTGTTAETVARFAAQRVLVSRARPDGLHRVVCGIDASDSSQAALALAADLCARVGAELDAVHASEPVEQELLEEDDLAIAAALSRDDATAAQFLRTCPPQIASARLTTRRGHADEVLRAFVAECRADLLVLGRKGRSGLRRVFLGATAERLLRSVPCSLLLTGPGAAGPSTELGG